MRLLVAFIVFTTLCSILKICVLVEGRYVVEVRLNGYSNPTGRCGDKRHCRTSGRIRCCDSFANTNCSGQHLCDSHFTYCLRPLGDDRQPPVGCSRSSVPNEYRDRSSVNTNDGPLNFSQSRLFGLNNPQVLSGLEVVYKGVQVYVDIQDHDEDGDNDEDDDDDIVDLLLIDHNLTVAQTVRQNHTGIYNLVTMDLTITVLCEGNFGGSDCTQCVPGFTGTNCSERDYCFGVNCSGNGQCSMHMDGMGSFQCTCDPGFTGELCWTNIDDCVGVNCSGNGACIDGVNNYTCECTPGFSGPTCSEADSVTLTSTSNGSGLLAGALGGGISGALLLLIAILLLSTSCTIALCWSRKSKKINHCDHPLQEQVYDETDNKLKSDHEFELKSNEAYSSTTHYIPTEDNVAYGQIPNKSTHYN